MSKIERLIAQRVSHLIADVRATPGVTRACLNVEDIQEVLARRILSDVAQFGTTDMVLAALASVDGPASLQELSQRTHAHFDRASDADR